MSETVATRSSLTRGSLVTQTSAARYSSPAGHVGQIVAVIHSEYLVRFPEAKEFSGGIARWDENTLWVYTEAEIVAVSG